MRLNLKLHSSPAHPPSTLITLVLIPSLVIGRQGALKVFGRDGNAGGNGFLVRKWPLMLDFFFVFFIGLNTLAAPLQWLYARFLVFREQQAGNGKSVIFKEELINFSPRSLLGTPRKSPTGGGGGGGTAGQDRSGSRQGHGRATVSHSRDETTSSVEEKLQSPLASGESDDTPNTQHRDPSTLVNIDSSLGAKLDPSTPRHSNSVQSATASAAAYESAQPSPRTIPRSGDDVTRRPSNSSHFHASPLSATQSSTPVSRQARMSPLHSMRPPVTTTHYIFEDPPHSRGSDSRTQRPHHSDSRVSSHANSPRMEISVAQQVDRKEHTDLRSRDEDHDRNFDSRRPPYNKDGLRQRLNVRDRRSDDPLDRFYVSRSGGHDRRGVSQQLDRSDSRPSVDTHRSDRRDHPSVATGRGDDRPSSSYDFGNPDRSTRR